MAESGRVSQSMTRLGEREDEIRGEKLMISTLGLLVP
jgi:hypothetical protein